MYYVYYVYILCVWCVHMYICTYILILMSMNSRCCIQELLFVHCFNTTAEFNHYLPQTVHVLLFKFIYLCIILEIFSPLLACWGIFHLYKLMAMTFVNLQIVFYISVLFENSESFFCNFVFKMLCHIICHLIYFYFLFLNLGLGRNRGFCHFFLAKDLLVKEL